MRRPTVCALLVEWTEESLDLLEPIFEWTEESLPVMLQL